MLEEAKRSLSITAMWVKLGFPGKPGRQCNDPRGGDEGKKSACSIFVATSGKNSGLEMFKNHRTGEVFDAPGLLAAVTGLGAKEACRRFLELAGVSVKPLDYSLKSNGAKRQKPAPAPNAAPATVPPTFDFRLLNPRPLEPDEIDAIATTRNVSARAIEWLMSHGVLHTVAITRDVRLPIPLEVRPFHAWSLHTPCWQSFRIRAFAGLLPGFGGSFSKSLTPSGASCSLPVWIGSSDASRVVIVEGEADAIGAAELIRRERSAEGLAVVCIFSSSIAIHSSFLHRIEGRRVRIIPHIGDARRQGEIAAVKWAAQVKPWAADVHIFSLAGLEMCDGKYVGDLGDLAQCAYDVSESLKGGITIW
jgi:hypothetical protein